MLAPTGLSAAHCPDDIRTVIDRKKIQGPDYLAIRNIGVSQVQPSCNHTFAPNDPILNVSIERHSSNDAGKHVLFELIPLIDGPKMGVKLMLRLATWFGPLRRFILAHPWNVRVEWVVFRSAGA